MNMIQTTTSPRNAAVIGRPPAASFDASSALEKLLALGSPPNRSGRRCDSPGRR